MCVISHIAILTLRRPPGAPQDCRALNSLLSPLYVSSAPNGTEQLRHLSRTDSLTGLYNHRTIYERLGEELKRATRYQKSLSIVLIDLDNFKSVNDTRGHQSVY